MEGVLILWPFSFLVCDRHRGSVTLTALHYSSTAVFLSYTVLKVGMLSVVTEK